MRWSFLSIIKLGLVWLCFVSGPANAERLHVRSDGLRESGASLANDWSLENCYSDMALAALSASPDDSLLLYAQEFSVDNTIELPSFVGNMNLDASYAGTTVRMMPTGQLVIPNNLVSFKVLGLTVTSEDADSDLAAFRIEDRPVDSAEVIFQYCRFTSNRGSDVNGRGGSCLYAQGNGQGSLVAIVGCLFEDNICRGKGGALFFESGYEAVISDTQFLRNESRNRGNVTGRGGAISVRSYDVATNVYLSDVLFDGNRAWGPGGSIFLDDASLSMTDCQLLNSESAVDFFTEWSAGAGILMRRTEFGHLDPIALDLMNCQFDGSVGHLDTNPWAGDGGAVLVKGIDDRYVDVTVAHCSFTNNFNAQGAGIYIGRFATGTVSHCVFRDNTAYLQGGATFKGGAFEANLGETAVYSYCEFSGNQAGLDVMGNPTTVLGRGGVFSNRLNTRAEFYNCTFYNNLVHGAMSDGDAIMLPAEGGTFFSDLQRCVFVNNVFYGPEGNSVQISADDGSISLVSHCAYEEGEIQAGSLVPEYSVLLVSSPFAGENNLVPHSGSPLIDTAMDNGQMTDLAGTLVPTGLEPDIGAYENPFVSHVPSEFREGSLLKVYPNPFNPRTELHYSLQATGEVAVSVFDLSGRKMTELVKETQAPGEYTVLWQGTDGTGRAVPSGIYLARIQVDDQVGMTKMTLIR